MTAKLGKSLSLAMIFLIMACGAITVELDTEVTDETEITHDFSMQASGQIAALLAGDFDEDDLPESCTSVFDQEMFEVNCTGLSQSDLAENKLAVGDDGLAVEVTKEDLGDHWEYRVTAMNLFFDAEDELGDSSLTEGMDLDAIGMNIDTILKARFRWTVEVPGEILETNADTTEGRVTSFNADLSDTREEFLVVSRQEKSTGLFGSCS